MLNNGRKPSSVTKSPIPVEYFLYLKSRQAAPVPGGAIRFSKNISENIYKMSKTNLEKNV